MIEQVNGFITPMKEWDAVGKNFLPGLYLAFMILFFLIFI